MKRYIYTEPHEATGGHCLVIVTEDDILSYMKKIHPNEMDKRKLINDFCTTHWASEVPEEDYRVLQKSPEQLQKVLNQWKHEYDLRIISTVIYGGLITAIVKRSKKEIKT